MSKKEKLFKELENHPKNVSFNTIEKLLKWYGYELVSTKGSHHKFKKESKSIIVPLHKPIKEIYVKQILEFLKDEK